MQMRVYMSCVEHSAAYMQWNSFENLMEFNEPNPSVNPKDEGHLGNRTPMVQVLPLK